MAKAYLSSFKVALIQMKPKPLDPAHNFKVASDYITSAAQDGASLAVLPEYHISGWAPEDPLFTTIASEAPSWTERYQTLAAKLKINIVPGTIVQTAPGSSKEGLKPSLLNIATFISSTGEILGSYTKTNLWHPERPHLTSSVQHAISQSTPDPSSEFNPVQPAEHSIIDTPLGKVGILVCWDLAFPEPFRSLISAGARIIIIPTFWLATDLSAAGLSLNKDAESLFLRSALTTRAFENTACVIFVNAGGAVEEGYLGLSQVCMPILGRLEGGFEGCEEGCRLVEVDLGVLDVAEQNYKVREDILREGWHYGYTHAPPSTGL